MRELALKFPNFRSCFGLKLDDFNIYSTSLEEFLTPLFLASENGQIKSVKEVN